MPLSDMFPSLLTCTQAQKSDLTFSTIEAITIIMTPTIVFAASQTFSATKKGPSLTQKTSFTISTAVSNTEAMKFKEKFALDHARPFFTGVAVEEAE